MRRLISRKFHARNTVAPSAVLIAADRFRFHFFFALCAVILSIVANLSVVDAVIQNVYVSGSSIFTDLAPPPPSPFFPEVATMWGFGNVPYLSLQEYNAEVSSSTSTTSLFFGSASMFPRLLCRQEEDATSEDSDAGGFDEPTTNRNGKRSRPDPPPRAPIEHEDHRYDPQDWMDSTWYKLYVLKRPAGKKKEKKFRARFRLPYASFLTLVAEMREDNWFPNVGRCNALGQAGIPLELLVLGALRVLGRGWCFDDVEEASAVSCETHRKFFHRFVAACAEKLYPKWVRIPQSEEEVAEITRVFEMAGMPGCIGSTDATHVVMERCTWRLRNSHLGAKSSHTTKAFQITVDHKRRILASTGGLPGRWNDKTVVRFDDFVTALHEGKILRDVEYTVAGQKVRGAWLVVDNGYLAWPETIPPFKTTTSVAALRWSKWVEAIRKDVECTFGILKGRWRILKTPIRIHSHLTIDNIWFTCCALHNMLLDIDGLKDGWEAGVHSDYEGRFGDLEGSKAGTDASRVYDAQLRKRRRGATDGKRTPAGQTFRRVSEIGYHGFRGLLVEHFALSWGRSSVSWPARNDKLRKRTS